VTKVVVVFVFVRRFTYPSLQSPKSRPQSRRQRHETFVRDTTAVVVKTLETRHAFDAEVSLKSNKLLHSKKVRLKIG
jgi:hypothetical protein